MIAFFAAIGAKVWEWLVAAAAVIGGLLALFFVVRRDGEQAAKVETLNKTVETANAVEKAAADYRSDGTAERLQQHRF